VIESTPTAGRSAPIKNGDKVEATTIGENYAFDGFVVTSIDYKKIGTRECPNLVEFSESTVGNEEAALNEEDRKKHNQELVDAATYLKNVKFVGGKDEEGSRIFTGESLTIDKVEEEFVQKYGSKAKPFFSVFGYSGEAGYIMDTCSKSQLIFDEQTKAEGWEARNIIIPVIWPSNGSVLPTEYLRDKVENIPEAEKEFSMLIEGTLANANVFKSKNLLCHSLGNRLLSKTANGSVKFDNIFMAAPDVRHNLFDKKFIERVEDEDHMQGMNIFKMLAQNDKGEQKGKIYCLYNPSDYALNSKDTLTYSVVSLGTVGIGSYDSWGPGWSFDEKKYLHPEIYGHTENKDVYYECKKEGYPFSHSYSYYRFAVMHYGEKIQLTGQ